jgi:hypothetical protein
MNLIAFALIATVAHLHPSGILALLSSLALIGGTVAVASHPNPLVPAASPDNSTLPGQAENLRAQFEVLSGTTDVIAGGGGALSSIGKTAPITGKSLITSTGVNATTLATPVAGDPSAGGNDGLTIEITDLGGHAHTVTTAANKINGNKHIATFPGTVGARIVLTAYNGIWYSDGGGTTLS